MGTRSAELALAIMLLACGAPPEPRAAPPRPSEPVRLVGRHAEAPASLLPDGYAIGADTFVEGAGTDRDVGCMFVTGPGDRQRMIVLYERHGFGTDKVDVVIDDVVELAATTRPEQLTAACDGKPTCAILAWDDRCAGVPARAQRAWRIAQRKLALETAAISCMRVCDTDQ